MKKVIVTGANGFLGKYLLRELVKKDYEVWAIIRSSNTEFSFLDEKNIHVVYCDLREIGNLSVLIKERYFDCFYNLAWDGSFGVKREDYKLQLMNARFCADAVKVASLLKSKRFVGIGSVTELMYRDFLTQDGSEPDMVAIYAIGKMAAEYISRCVASNEKIEFLWAYISNFYGNGDRTDNFVNRLIKDFTNGIIPSLTSGNQKADFMYVSDVARAIVAMGERGISGKNYYVGYGAPRPLKEFVVDIRDAINNKVETGLGKKKFQGMDIDFDRIKVDKLRIDTGFVPEISFIEGIKQTV